MRKTPYDVERDVRARLLRGESYESASGGRVCKATVNRVVEDLRKDVPEFDELRELAIRIRNEGRSVAEVLQSLEEKEDMPPIIVTCYENANKNPASEYLESVLAWRFFCIPCKNCGNQIQIRLESAGVYSGLVANGLSLLFGCPCCGRQMQYNPFEILGYLALNLLQKDEIVVPLEPPTSFW